VYSVKKSPEQHRQTFNLFSCITTILEDVQMTN